MGLVFGCSCHSIVIVALADELITPIWLVVALLSEMPLSVGEVSEITTG
jgi:hypothetical protein